MPGQPREELLDIVTCRRADGREVSLSEYPLAVQFAKGETVRAEELVLSVPDGRSVRVLVNATPIQSADGAVESVVVAMQDLAPLDEIERLRAEFLSLVSHELRQPLSSIKGSAVTLLEDGANLDRAEMREFPSHRRRAGRSHAGPHRRPPRCRGHRLRDNLGCARSLGPGGAGGAGKKRLPEHGRAPHRSHRPAAGPPPGDGGATPHRAGAE